MADIAHPLASSSRPFAGLTARLAIVWKKYCYRRTVLVLSGLSDRQLDMAGIARADIPSVAARVASN